MGSILALLKLKGAPIALLIIILLVAGGWVLYIIERDKLKEAEIYIDTVDSSPDTIYVEGEVSDSVTADTVTIYVDKFIDRIRDSIICDTLRQDSIIYITERHTGTVQIDTTIPGKIDFSATVRYPSGESVLSFGFPERRHYRRKWFAGGGVGYSASGELFAVADISYARYGLGVLAKDDFIGGYIRVNF